VQPLIDPDIKIGRTREFITGFDRQLIPNMHVAVDFIYRYNDLGTAGFIDGFQPGTANGSSGTTGAGFPVSGEYNTTPNFYTDPITGITAPYFTVRDGVVRASGTTRTATSVSYSTYHGVTVTLGKRLSHGWQANGSYTWNDQRGFNPVFSNPTGRQFTEGFSNGTSPWVIKINGSVQLWWGITAAANFNANRGNIRTMTVNGPGAVPGGVTATGAPSTISYSTLTFQNLGTTRLPNVNLLDISGSKNIKLPGSNKFLTVTVDVFNVNNNNTILGFASGNLSTAFLDANGVPRGAVNQVSSIIAPRVLRVLGKITF
jgi:hypothetical protein